MNHEALFRRFFRTPDRLPPASMAVKKSIAYHYDVDFQLLADAFKDPLIVQTCARLTLLATETSKHVGFKSPLVEKATKEERQALLDWVGIGGFYRLPPLAFHIGVSSLEINVIGNGVLALYGINTNFSFHKTTLDAFVRAIRRTLGDDGAELERIMYSQFLIIEDAFSPVDEVRFCDGSVYSMLNDRKRSGRPTLLMDALPPLIAERLAVSDDRKPLIDFVSGLPHKEVRYLNEFHADFAFVSTIPYNPKLNKVFDGLPFFLRRKKNSENDNHTG